MDMFILPFMSSHQVLFQLLWYVTTRSNSKFAIAWVESSVTAFVEPLSSLVRQSTLSGGRSAGHLAKAKLVRYADDFVVLARYQRGKLSGWIESKLEGWNGFKEDQPEQNAGDRP